MSVYDAAMSEFPSYPRDAAEREEAAVPDEPELALAGWWSRVGAYLLDILVLLVPLFVVFVAVLASQPDDDDGAWAVLGLVYLASLVLPFVYFTVMHGGERGQTLGKRALGIRVVDQKGGSIGYGKAFGRYGIVFLLSIFFLPLVLDYLWPLWDSKNQALHDKVVSSVVVRS